jgi:hypothetical protein
MVSPWFSFHHTRYYEKEMGSPLVRRLLSFSRLISLEDFADIKLCTNRIEERLAEDGRRRVNIDPGYLVLERFVLATGKNYAHRIYLRKGIYADLTLVFRRGGFAPLPWTYPDYAEDEIRGFLGLVRINYQASLKKDGATDDTQHDGLCKGPKD